MRHDQPHKADTASHGYTYADQRSHAYQHSQLDRSHRHAHVTRRILTQRKGVELIRARKQYAAENRQCTQQHQRLRVSGTRERAHGPESDGAQLFS